jgi:hypothetical protein
VRSLGVPLLGELWGTAGPEVLVLDVRGLSAGAAGGASLSERSRELGGAFRASRQGEHCLLGHWMAHAFRRAGYANFEREINMTWD